MASSYFDPLSAQDQSFLLGEGPTTHMHVAGVQIFERGPLGTEDGGVDFDTLKKAMAAVLHRIPRYRQKLQWTPLSGRAVWVDDRDFNLDYHMRHTGLPRPGGLEQLKRLAARVMAQPLDRARPLWETWAVEGLDGDRFALITKIHHCMIDGSSGVDLAQILLSTAPEFTIAEPPRFFPRPEPGWAELVRAEWLRSASLPLRAARGLRAFRRETEDVRAELGLRARALTQLFGWAVRPTGGSPVNGPLGPHRRFDWLKLPLSEVRTVRKAAGFPLNDVVLAVVTGALRRYFEERGAHPDELEFRVSAPVSVRRPEERGQLGNRVSSWIVRLPLEVATARERLEAVHAITGELKASKQAMGVEMMMQVAEWTPPVLLSLGSQATAGPINSIVTNVPGPQFPLYMLGARLLEMYPLVPLLPNMGFATALFSYDGWLFWGFNADYGLVPDLERMPALFRQAFLDLARELGVALPASRD